MYAIIETGSKQYKVQKGDLLDVERIDIEPGKEVKIDKVLFCANGKSYEIGKPYIKDAKVVCEVVSQPRGEKLIAFKYRRRKNSRKKIGHRQELTRLRVKALEIS